MNRETAGTNETRMSAPTLQSGSGAACLLSLVVNFDPVERRTTVAGPTIAKLVFGICLFLVVYTYFLYPALLFLTYSLVQARRYLRYLMLRRKRRASDRGDSALPAVSLVIAAYNEQSCLENRIQNIREIDYPSEKLEVVFVSDGSTDRTNEILQSSREPNFQLLLLPSRGGKANALNQGVAQSHSDILVFSDASTLFAPDAVRNLVRHFSKPGIGVVCGSARLVGNLESQQTEGLYWRYEGALRLMEARLGATLNASGCIYALRRQCYRPLEAGELIDDFSVPMNARTLGYKVIEDPEAVATDFSADSVKGEFARRIRLAIGSFGALRQVRGLPLFSFTSFAFVSHKVLRWILPFLLIGLLISNAFLLGSPFGRIVFMAQVLFYVWAALGFLFRNHIRHFRFALFGYFLVAVHLAFLIGFWRYVSGRTESAWQKVS